MFDPQASRVTLAGGALIADSDGASGSGLTAYSQAGRVLYRLYAGREVSFIGAVAGRGYADVGAGRAERVVAFSLRSGSPMRAGDAAAVWQLLFGTHATFAAAGF